MDNEETGANDSIVPDHLAAADLSDDESVLSDVDEAQFEGFDPANVAIDDRPALAIDEENLKLIGRHKRRRTEEDEEAQRKKKKKESKREKKSRRKQQDSDDAFSGGETVEGKRSSRKRKEGGSRTAKVVPEVNEEDLDPATRMIDSLMSRSRDI